MKINCSPEEILALATSITLAIVNNFDKLEVATIKCLLSNICSSLGLYEIQAESIKIKCKTK